jgi:hypothetical protein
MNTGISPFHMLLLKSYSKTAIGKLFLVGLLFMGCAAVEPVTPVAIHHSQEVVWPDKRLPNRMALYWAFRFAGNTQKGFEMEAPHFREMVEVEKYGNYTRHASKNRLLKMEVLRVDTVSENFVVVQTRMTIQEAGQKTTEISSADRWVRVKGAWYHLIKDRMFFDL